MKKICYEVPEVEDLNVVVELGFAGSDVLEDMDPDGEDM